MTARLRPAEPADLDALLALMRALYDEDGVVPFRPDRHRHATLELLASPDAGGIWVLEDGGMPVGYVVITIGFSLEHGGRDAFLDELYVAPSHRGQGLGRQALDFVDEECRRRHVKAVHLEVERANPAAEALYTSHGYRNDDRRLLTRRLD